MLISAIHPTARVKPYPSFPNGWLDACNNFYANCKDPKQVEYVLVVHECRFAEFVDSKWRDKVPEWGLFRVVCNMFRDCVVDQVNLGFKKAHHSTKLLLGIMDDSTAPPNWDAQVLASVPDLDGEYVAHYSSGSPRDTDLIVAGAMTRKRYEAKGFCLHPDYISLYADDDFTQMAKNDGVYVDARHIEFLHMHPCFGRGEWDDIYSNENKPESLLRGITTYNKRKANGFTK